MKYKLTDTTIKVENGIILYEIEALKDFADVAKGNRGGFIQSEKNLSQHGNCWVYDRAKVYHTARVCDDARVYQTASIYNCAEIGGSAKVSGDARVYDNAFVFGRAWISGGARVYGESRVLDNVYISDSAHVYEKARIEDHAVVAGEAHVYGGARVYNNGEVSGKARVYGSAYVFGQARIGGDAEVFEHAIIEGSAKIVGRSRVSQDQTVSSGVCLSPLDTDLIESIRLQTGLIAVNGKVTAFKEVRSDLTSQYDICFQYKVGEFAEVDDFDPSNTSCASGLHFSNGTYWDGNIPGSTYLIAEIFLEDIITVQSGKIRCKRAYIIGSYTPQLNTIERY